MNIRLFPTRLGGSIVAVASKSHVHRALIGAAMADHPTRLLLGRTSQDIAVTAGCLKAIGAKIDMSEEGHIDVFPLPNPGRHTVARAALDCMESGSTLRFLLPVAAAVCQKTLFTGSGRLPKRPMIPLIQAMEAHGCRFEGTVLPFTVNGMMTGGEFFLPGNVSSQFITGILLALPLVGGGEVTLTTPIESSGYLRLTVDTMAQFGVWVHQMKKGYRVASDARYRSPGTLVMEGDWSNSAVWLAAAAMGNPVEVTGLSYAASQGDKEVVSLLRAAGASVQATNDKITISPASSFKFPPVVDAADIPDLIPVLSVLALFNNGETRFVNAGRLRLKESDRLAALSQELRKLGGDITETPDGLAVRGTGRLKGGTANGCGDHRIVMALAAASIICDNPVTIHEAQAVEKSYPAFFDDLVKLGGKTEVVGL